MTNIIDTLYPAFLECRNVSTDSRHIQPGSIFFALKGANFNGNQFAAIALELGARYAVIDEAACSVNDRCIVVDDVMTTLQELARHHRMQFDIPLVAITGTNGKTTTKELTHAVLSQKYNTLSTQGNLNNHIGVPLTLLKLTKDTEIGLIEMGANHPGEIGFLCRIAQPGFGLITNIGKAHLEGFGGFEGVLRTKTELYRFIREMNGTIFLHNQNELLQEHAKEIRAITYGTPPADVVGTPKGPGPFVTMQLQFHQQSELLIESNLFGGYNGYNIMAAACIGQYFGILPEQVKTAIEAYKPDNNRSQVTKTTQNTLILDAYNANPSSMEAALKTFAGSDYPDKTVILGDMLELGEESDQEHQQILALLDDLGFTRVYLIGPVFTRMNTKRENLCFHDSELAKLWLGHHRIIQATVLIKGSRGVKLEKLIEVL